MLEYKIDDAPAFQQSDKYFYEKVSPKRWLIQHNYIKIAFPYISNNSHNIQLIKNSITSAKQITQEKTEFTEKLPKFI